MTNTPHIFLTGGSGFIGRRLIPFLRQNGYKVFALVRSRAAAEVVRERGAYAVPGNLYNHTALVDMMKICGVVVHAAALRRFWGDPKDFYTTNVEGTISVYDAARAAGVHTLIYVSDASVIHGAPVYDADENYLPRKMPKDLYSETKYQAERAILQNSSDTMRTIILRPALVWGPEDPHIDVLRAAIAQKVFRWIGGGKHLLSTCHVDNLAAAILAACERGVSGSIYYITDGEARPVKEFFSAYAHAFGLNLGDKSVPRPLALTVASAVMFIWNKFKLKGELPLLPALVTLLGTGMTVSEKKARDELGYQNVISIDEGLKALFDPRLN